MFDDTLVEDAAGQRTLTVRAALAEAESLCRRELAFEATALFSSTLARFLSARDEYRAWESVGMKADPSVFVGALRRFSKKLLACSAMSLVARVVDYKYLLLELEAIHTGRDGMDAVFPTAPGVQPTWDGRAKYEDARAAYSAVLARALDAAIAVWTTDLVAHRALIEEADRVLQTSKGSKDVLRWNELAMKAEPRVSWLAAQALTHALNSGHPSWFIAEDQVQCRAQIARGSFGSVFLGKLGNQTEIDGPNVVIKQLLPNNEGLITDEMRAAFTKEVNLWSQLTHPYVLRLFGANHTCEQPFMVCEFAENGDLAGYFRRVGIQQIWRMLYEVAVGIAHLHDKSIIHGDLKLNNFVVGNDGCARVTDFSLTRLKRSASVYATKPEPGIQAAGALRWCAPECVGPYGVAPQLPSDVYSFGMCIFEAFANEPPYCSLPDGAVAELIKDGTLPGRPVGMPDEAWELIEKTTRLEPGERPTMREVVQEMWKFAERETLFVTTRSTKSKPQSLYKPPQPQSHEMKSADCVVS